MIPPHIASHLRPESLEAVRRTIAGVRRGELDPELVCTALAEDPDWIRQPVGIREFIESPSLLGMSGVPWPGVLADLEALFAGEYFEAVLKGGIGWGKTYFADFAFAYMLYKLSCLRDPQRFYGLASGSIINFVNVSTTITQAKKVMFEGLRGMVLRSPYFRRFCPPDRNFTTELRFPNGVWVCPAASRESGVIGQNIFGGVMDESNFMPNVEDSKLARPGEGLYDAAESICQAITNRIVSRFNELGRVPGLLIIISSSRYPDDFTDRKAAEATNNPTLFVRDHASWETRPQDRFKPERFTLEIGDATNPSRVLVPGQRPRDGSRLKEVPEDFRREAERNPDRFAQEMVGIPLAAVNAFILKRWEIDEAIDPDRIHPFTQEVIVGSEAIPLLLHAITKIVEGGTPSGGPLSGGTQRVPLYHPDCLWVAHVDLAITRDRCGVAMGCSPGKKAVLRWDATRLTEYEFLAPEIFILFALGIKAPPGGEVDIKSVRTQLLAPLRALGFKLVRVTYDQYQSAESIQEWKKGGVASELLSVDKTTEGYDAFKDGLYEHRLHYPRSEALSKEARELLLDVKKNKIDHPARGSKDITDAVAGVCHHLTYNPPSAPGLWQPGVVEKVIRPGGDIMPKEVYDWLKDDEGESFYPAS